MTTMTTETRLPTTFAAPLTDDWRNQAACRTADPDLFCPEPDTSKDRIREAKAICAGCPVKQACLDEAFRTNDRFGICGGLTVREREQLLKPSMPMDRFQARRFDNASARKIAVQNGADLLVWLVKRHISVADAAERLEATPRAVYGAFRILVPESKSNVRKHLPSSIEKFLATSKESLRTLERIGRSHSEIGHLLGTSQSIVSASLAVLKQRDDALRRVSRKGPKETLELIQAEETRVRREAGVGLTVEDVIAMAGTRILSMTADGKTLRAVAQELDLNREAVRQAYQQMTKSRFSKDLTKTDMEEAA